MRGNGRCTGVFLASGIALMLGALAVFALMDLQLHSASSETTAAGQHAVTSKVRICHVSDFHAAFERRADRVGKQYYARCAKSKFALSKPAVIQKVFHDHCDVKIFTGDLMHGGDYDLVQGENNVAPRLLSLWEVDVWAPGNHDLDSGATLAALNTRYQPPLVCSNLETFKYNVLSYKLLTFSSGTEASVRVCVYGIIRPDLVDQVPDLFSASDPVKALRVAYAKSLKDGCGDPIALHILMSHSGWDYDLDLIQELERDRRLPHFDLVLGGHTHQLVPQTYPYPVNSTVLSHVGAYGGWVGVITLDLVVATDELEGSPARNLYIPWSAGKLPSLQRKWQLNQNESFRTSTRYRILKRSSNQIDGGSAARGLDAFPTTLLEDEEQGVVKGKALDEAEHGYLIRGLKPPALESGSLKSVMDYTLLTSSAFKTLCDEDHQLLSNSRAELARVIGELTMHKVATLPKSFNTTEESITCRRGQCNVGRWLGKAVMLMPTATSKIEIVCPESSVKSVSETCKADAAECEKKEEKSSAAALKDVNTVLGVVQSGVIRSQIPAACESQFELLAGGCHLRGPSSEIDLYDIDRLLPFHNKVRLIVLKSLDSLCDILQEVVLGWEAHGGSSPGLLHFGNLRYFRNPKRPELARGRKPMFDELWVLQDDEELGVEITNLQAEIVRGSCVKGDTIQWRCAQGLDCARNLGKILILGTELLIGGADGKAIRWLDHADSDFLRSVAKVSYSELKRQKPGCWLDSLKQFTVNDAAALFLNATIALDH